ncbi:MAG: type II secretion system protein [Gallionella sp.]|jgi:prepilin-type N-terminal cleavage/methylation domain-containing protein|nr:type II secretion system GspH family protein [Gallionella sp.]MCK9354621.1 type II secretion system GspH family protein [Gallionella sp.]
MINHSEYHQTQGGFTLVEMAMVLLIIGLLLSGLMPTLSAQMEAQRIKETQHQMNEIKEALIGFALIYGRLPCPADATIATGQPDSGKEKSSCLAGNNGGVLPWVTLGVNETDAWGRRFTYRVTPAFATVTPLFLLSSSANLDVGLTSNSSDTSVAFNVPAIVVSHGSNGLGAYTPAGGTPPTTATGDELDNVASDNNNHFVSHDFVQNGFDDIVAWISPNTLMNRMVAAGKLP